MYDKIYLLNVSKLIELVKNVRPLGSR